MQYALNVVTGAGLLNRCERTPRGELEGEAMPKNGSQVLDRVTHDLLEADEAVRS